MKTIELEKSSEGTIMAAHYIDGKPEQEMIDLFETHIIPTAYRNDLAMAHDAISKLNPDYTVTVKQQEA